MGKIKENLIWYSIGALAVLCGVTIGGYIYPNKSIPNTSKVAPGYVIPAKIEELAVKDLNQDGKLEETIIRYKGKTLLFKETSNGGVEGIPFDISEKNY